MKPKVTVLGWYGQGNLGDEAYKIAFPLLFPGVEFEFVNDIKSVNSTVVLGGGDVYNAFYIDKLRRLSARKFAMSVNCTDKQLIDQSIAMFDKVFFRAHNTAFVNDKVRVFPDFTFILEPSILRGKELIERQFKETDSDKYERVIVVVMNSFLSVNEGLLARDYLNFEKVATDLAQIFDETSASFLFLPFTNGFPQNDRITNSVVYSRCKFWKKNSLWYRPISVQEALDICCAANLTISSRLHGDIFSVIGGTPFIDLTHHSKTHAFLDFINRPEWSVNYWKFDGERLANLIGAMVGDKKERFLLEKLASGFRSELKTVQSYVHFTEKI